MEHKEYKNIICFGEILWDMLPQGAKPGGAPLNVAIHLKRHEQNPLLVSRAGTDKEGENLRHFLIEEGLNTGAIQTDSKLPTGKVLVDIDEAGNATYKICEPVAWDNIEITEELEKSARSADLLIYGSLASRNKTSRETLLHLLNISPVTRLVDINLRPPFDDREWVEELLHLSDFAKLNDDELKKITGWNGISGSEKSMIKWLSEFFRCETVCVTRGDKGAILYTDGKFAEHNGFKINVADTVGAGDAFLAGLISALSQNRTPGEALEFASATGAFVASRTGAVPGYSAEDIYELLKKL